jgi:DNA-binding response OmpR family regulator
MNQLAKPKILLVEDEVDLREIMAEELASYQVIQASDGQEALDLLAQGRIDLIVSDINMPRLDGLTMLERLRDQGHTVPVIIVSGYGDTQKRARAQQLGAASFLDKPIAFDSLLKAVDAALKGAR